MKYLVTHNYYEYHSSGIVEASSEDEAVKIFITKLIDYCEKNNADGSCYLFCCPDIEDYDSIEELVANYEYPIQAIPLNYDTGLMVYKKSYNKLEMIPID